MHNFKFLDCLLNMAEQFGSHHRVPSRPTPSIEIEDIFPFIFKSHKDHDRKIWVREPTTKNGVLSIPISTMGLSDEVRVQ